MQPTYYKINMTPFSHIINHGIVQTHHDTYLYGIHMLNLEGKGWVNKKTMLPKKKSWMM